MKKSLYPILIFFALLIGSEIQAQGMAFGAKGGVAAAFGRGQLAHNSALFGIQGDLFIESLPAGNDHALFAQAGYHTRGSAARRLSGFGSFNQAAFRQYEFNNLALSFGYKQKFDWGYRKAYYMFGLRGEYTLDHNIDEVQESLTEFQTINPNFNPLLSYPVPDGVRQWNYGLLVGAGIELEFAEVAGAIIELSISPDLSPQYRVFGIQNVFNPATGTNFNIPESRFFNLSIELSVGIRLLRIIEYVD